MALGNILWWLLFTICSIWGQVFFPGVDFLVAGFAISLQEGRRYQTLWLGVMFVFIQEGLGTLPFGGAILWYGAAVLLYRLGRYLFESRNVLFILLMGVSFGFLRYGLTRFIMSMQGYEYDPMVLTMDGFKQAVLFPMVWSLATLMRPRRESDAYVAG